MTKAIDDKLRELFEATPKEISIGFGRKSVNGQFTDKQAIVFLVPKKLPLDQIPKDQILPSSVEIEGVTYKTDVLESGPTHTTTVKYNLQPGMGVWSESRTVANIGALGPIVLDIETNALLGLTANHVVVKNGFYTNERLGNNTVVANELNNDSVYYQVSIQPTTSLGKVLKYVPLSMVNSNQVDAALIALDSNVISLSAGYYSSWNILSLPPGKPLRFATTQEINNIIQLETPLKIGYIGPAPTVLPYLLNVSTYIAGFPNNGSNVTAPFNNLIALTASSPSGQPVFTPGTFQPGYSGACVALKLESGEYIIGGIFIGANPNGSIGYFCRIDEIAPQLNIKAWDGTAQPYVDLNSIQIKATYNTSGQKTINCGGKQYWQVGSSNNTNYCS